MSAPLILPTGLEKWVPGDLMEMASRLNVSGAQGYGLFLGPGEIFTEVNAIKLLTGAESELIAARRRV